MNPLIEVLGAAALLVMAVVGGYVKGERDAEAKAKIERLQAVERAIAQAGEQAAIDREILAAAAERQAAIQTKTRTLIRTVTRHVETPVYRGCELDACGLCLAREAAAGRDGAACPCGPDAALPATGSAARPDDGGAAGGVH